MTRDPNDPCPNCGTNKSPIVTELKNNHFRTRCPDCGRTDSINALDHL